MKRQNFNKIRNINDKVLMSLESEAKDYRVTVEERLYFLVKSNGNKYWQVKYKNIKGKWSLKSIGTFPMVNLSQAIEKLEKFLSELKKVDASNKKDVKDKKYMLISLMENWLPNKKRLWTEKTYDKAIKSIQKHIYSTFGQRDFRDITSKEWCEYFQSLVNELKIPTQMRKLFSYVSEAYDWASIYCDYNENPVKNIKRFLGKHKNESYKHIKLSEVKVFLDDIRAYPIKNISIGLELMLLQFPRHGELRQAKWEEFDLEKRIWIKPASKMKNRKEHRVYLSKQAIELLQKLKEVQKPSPYLFPSRDGIDRYMSDGPFTEALKKMGYKGRMTVHGVRYLASTALNEAFSGKSQVIEAALSHRKLGVKGRYDKAIHFEESAELIQWWADYVNNPNKYQRTKKPKKLKKYRKQISFVSHI